MAHMDACLWEYNLAKGVIVEVTDDYRFLQPPMPSEYYPVLAETWLPRHRLIEALPKLELLNGYLYDWHETPTTDDGNWVIGVVQEDLINPNLPMPTPYVATSSLISRA